MKTQDIIDHFSDLGKHVFTLNDVSIFTSKKRNYLSRLLVTNPKIKKIERNKYYIKGATIYEIATNIVEPSYISLAAAFSHYDLTTQTPVKVSVITPRRHKGLVFNNTQIEFRTIRRDRAFGYKKDGNTMMATPEKAILDSLYFGEPSYADVEDALVKGLREKVLETRKLMQYAKEMKSGILINRLGFLLEDNGVDATPLLKYKSRSNSTLFGRGKKRSNRWSIRYD